MRLELREARRRDDERRERRRRARDLALQLAFNTRRADLVFADLLELAD